jgi:hypothetical protein
VLFFLFHTRECILWMIRCISSTETLDWKPSTGLSPVSGLTTSLPPRTLQNSRPVAMIKQPHTLAGAMFWQTSIFVMSLKINRVSTWFFHTIQGIIYLDLGPRESPGPWAAEARTWNKPSWRPRRRRFSAPRWMRHVAVGNWIRGKQNISESSPLEGLSG